MRQVLWMSFVAPKRRCRNIRKYSNQAAQTHSTVDDNDVKNHSKMSKSWWNTNGEMRALHSFNPLRIQFIRDGLANGVHKEVNYSIPLEGLKILDIGCGGGILSEPLARIGASVTGIDASENLIQLAKEHATLDKSLSERITYHNTTIENHTKKNSNYYDAVVASEILEHVSNQELFLQSCIDVLKPGGSLFITTLNQTYLSLFGAIFAAEYLLRIVPTGTHNWEKFISPTKVRSLLEKYGCQTQLIHGIAYNPMTNKWLWIKSTAINYGLHAVKISES